MSSLCCSQTPPQAFLHAMKCLKAQVLGRRVGSKAFESARQWTFLGGSALVLKGDLQKSSSNFKGFVVSASWLTSTQLASNAFTWGTVAVLPFYMLMVLSPSAALTRRATESNLPFVVLGVVYAYLLYRSWTPDTMRLMFASKYWLPELTGISKMFLNEMTMASAWIHLLAVDLYAARLSISVHFELHIYVEENSYISLCLF
ncbi:hypothetical protein HPP92_000177 [Vanilla planifolia]|uniref:Neoxanthin synthase n=1 Tax=Vanilla planifolia TaxID=51239 RepID=A0A835RNN4_VANPL|nr:hypothetical protein HPP92_000177 [Vanilla planifolia]